MDPAVDLFDTTRASFIFPDHNGDSGVYLCGHSLGLQPRTARAAVDEVLDSWAQHGVDGHFAGDHPWARYDDPLLDLLGPVVGAGRDEVALMGTLTSNLHHLLASFYRPRGSRTKLLIESTAFPSDRYAAASQVEWHGLSSAEHLIEVQPSRDDCYSTEAVVETIHRTGDQLATVLIGGVNYYTGQLLDMAAITAAAHEVGAVCGFDLAHAAGNVPLELHRWEVDFAAWCTYKYLNSGPGAVAAIFVHDRHTSDPELLRLAGWWGNDPETRFDMDEQRAFVPRNTAASWAVSNPPILSLAPVRASLEIFAQVGMDRLRARSIALTGRLEANLRSVPGIRILTPENPEDRGAQLSLHLPGRADRVHHALARVGVVADVRPPDVIRLAPAPLYNSFSDIDTVIDQLARAVATA